MPTSRAPHAVVGILLWDGQLWCAPMILPVGVRGDLRSGWEDPRVERRTFLVLGAAAVGLAGCTSNATEPGPPSAPASPIPPEDPDARLREEVAASEVALIVAYRSAIEANPELAASLGPFLAHHEAHLARVAPGFSRGSGTSVASESPSAPSRPTGGSSDADDAAPSASLDATPSGSPEDAAPSGSPEAACLVRRCRTRGGGVSRPRPARDRLRRRQGSGAGPRPVPDRSQ